MWGSGVFLHSFKLFLVWIENKFLSFCLHVGKWCFLAFVQALKFLFACGEVVFSKTLYWCGVRMHFQLNEPKHVSKKWQRMLCPHHLLWWWIKIISHTIYDTMILKKTPWSESASELYRPSDRRLSAKWLPTCVDRRCHVVSVTDPSGCISRFLDRSRYFSIK
jgi:hypothetical protein